MTMSLKQAIPEYQELPFLKRGEVLKRSCKNDFLFVENKNSFSYQWLYTLPRFETEAWVQLGNGS